MFAQTNCHYQGGESKGKFFMEQAKMTPRKEICDNTVRHGPFDILGGGGGAWNFFEKKFLALILAEKNNLAQWHCEKNNLSPIA